MASTYLYRTPSSAGNQKTWTFSCWFKKATTGVQNRLFSAGATGSSPFSMIGFDSTTDFLTIRDEDNNPEITTNRKFRDVSAWYHVVVASDTTQATEANRLKVYVNGVQETSFETSTYPSQNFDWDINTTNLHYLGAQTRSGPSNYFDGYMSHAAFVDGTALTPTSFGETDSTSGIWKFKQPSGVTWGTNGFWLKFENSGNLGLDSSGNSNTFTVGGNGRQALDTPSNVYATFNSLDDSDAGGNFSNGNTTQVTETSPYGWVPTTLGMTSGKFYAECKLTAFSGSSNYNLIGVVSKQLTSSSQYLGGISGTSAYYGQGNVYNGSSSLVSTYASYTTNDIIGVAIDLDNSKLYFSKNGAWQNSGDPTSGSTGTGSLPLTAVGSTDMRAYFFASGDYGSSLTCTNSWNFGNGYFGTTAISSAGSNGNGSLFEYDVPSGYYALNTKNINT